MRDGGGDARDAREGAVEEDFAARGWKRWAFSCKVRRSARIWVGCHREDRAFRMGTGEYWASSCNEVSEV